MIARVVIGANFGDEGKGLVTDYLCAQGAGVVVRFNGGANAGHTVVTPDGERHVFSHFGSGSLLDVPTFLSHFFVCNPILFFTELKHLWDLGFHPVVYAHPDCLITTYADMVINQRRENGRGKKRHGSCGIGFHETLIRSKVAKLKITIGDLWNGGGRLVEQMEEICTTYAKYRSGAEVTGEDAIEAFISACSEFANYVNPLGIGQCRDPVFEGSQGLMLDQDNLAYYPHLTHSKTGMNNVEILCAQAGITLREIYYVSRTYLTRHGAGPLPGEDPGLSYEDDTNTDSGFQGKLRFAPLGVERMEEMLARCEKDAGGKSNLVLTHCDQEPPALNANLYASGPTRKDVTAREPGLIAVPP